MMRTMSQTRSLVKPSISWSSDVSMCYDILVTDDDDDVRAFITDALSYEGFTAWSLPTHALSTSILREIRPTLVIIELRHTTLTMVEGLLSRLNNSTPTRSISVLCTSTDARLLGSLETHPAFKQCRMLLKPFELTDLLSIVASVVDSPGAA